MVEPLLSGSLEALPAGLADLFSFAVVFVVGGDVADPLMQSVLRGSAPDDEHGSVRLGRSGA